MENEEELIGSEKAEEAKEPMPSEASEDNETAAEEAETVTEEAETAAADVKAAETESSEAAEASKPEKPAKQSIDFGAALGSLLLSIKRGTLDWCRSAAKSSQAIFLQLCAVLCSIGGCAFATGRKLLRSLWINTSYAAVTGFYGVRHDLRKIIPGTLGVLHYIGSSAWSVLSRIVSTAARAVWSVISSVFGTIFGWFAKKLKQPLYEVWCFLLTPFAHAYGSFAHAWIRLKNASKRGFFHVIGSALASFWKFLGGGVEILRFAFNYIAPAVSVFFLISLIRYSSTLQYAISVQYNGDEIATIDNEALYDEAQSMIQDKITYTEGDQALLVVPTFNITLLNSDQESSPVESIDALSEIMIERGDVSVVNAFGFYINGELFGVYSEENMELIRSALENRLAQYIDTQTASYRFEDDISITEGRFIEDALIEPYSALELINGATRVETYYVVEKGDSVEGICSKLGITTEEFERDNPTVDSLRTGDLITYHYLEPHLNVLTTHYENYGQVIEKVTQYEYSSRLEEYCERLVQRGSDGYENVTALITETNGVETDRTITSRSVVEEMVPTIFRTGTKENTYLDGNTDIIDTLGTFCWPVGGDGGYISTMPGYRAWDHSNHKALDIAGIPRGTSIYAACDGKVTFSGWYAAYGKLVIVDCGHGYECYYGHCSELLVEKGDRVEKGQKIAEVGATGNASGNHLHFEMRYRDDRIDPLMALGGTGGHDIRQ